MTDGTEQTTLGGPAAVREGGVPDWLLGGDGVVMSIGLLAALGLAGWAGHAWRRQLERRERHLGTLAVPLNRLTRAYLDCFTHLDAVPQVFEREKAYFLETRSDEGSPPDESGGDAMRAAEIDGFWRFVDQLERQALHEAERSLRVIANETARAERRLDAFVATFGSAQGIAARVTAAVGEIRAELAALKAQACTLERSFFGNPAAAVEMAEAAVVTCPAVFSGYDLTRLSASTGGLRRKLGLRAETGDDEAALLRERGERLPCNYQMRIVRRLETWRSNTPPSWEVRRHRDIGEVP